MPLPNAKIHFATDYDFEKANEQFQAALDDFKELIVDDKEAVEKKAASKNGQKDVTSNKRTKESQKKSEEPKAAVFYDKKKNFDSISCETNEKEGLQPNWRKVCVSFELTCIQERELNQKTFGTQTVLAFLSPRRWTLR